MGAGGRCTKQFLLRKIQHCIGEISSLDAGIGEAALHQHRVGESRSSEIGTVETTGESHDIGQICTAKVSTLQLGGVDDGPAQVRIAEVDVPQIGLEELFSFRSRPCISAVISCTARCPRSSEP